MQVKNLRKRNVRRRGATQVQWAVMAALILVVVIASVKTLGTNSKTNLQTTAGNIGNPSTLVNRFGSGS